MLKLPVNDDNNCILVDVFLKFHMNLLICKYLISSSLTFSKRDKESYFLNSVDQRLGTHNSSHSFCTNY